MNCFFSTVVLTMLFFSCSRGYYAIDASRQSKFVLQTKNYALNDDVESYLEWMKNKGNILKFDRSDSQDITYFKIIFPPKDSIKLKSLLMYSGPTKVSRVINVKGKPEFLLFSEINGNTDTIYYKKGSHIYVNKFKYRSRKVLGYKFYPY